MKTETKAAIHAILNADQTIDKADRDRVTKALVSNPKKPVSLISSRQAAKILDCHPKTLLRWAREGKLTPIRFSARRLRYDEHKVRELAATGFAQQQETSA